MRTLARRYPALLVGAFTLAWALIELVGPAAGVSPYQVVWTRYGVHLALVLLIFGRRDGLTLVRSAQPAREVFSSLLMLGMPVCFLWAVRHMPVGNTIAVFWLAPALVVAIAATFAGRVGGLPTVAAVAVGLLGALLICKPDARALAPVALLPLGMAACFALYLVTIGSMHHEPVRTKLFHTAFWVFASLTLVLPHFWHTPTPRGLAAMVVIGALGYVGLYALDLALEALPAAVLAPVLYTQLAWDVSLRALLRTHLHAPAPDAATLVGTLLVIAAAVPALRWRAPAVVPTVAAVGREVPA